jgi:hypothetical protein
MITVAEFYGEVIAKANAQTAKGALRTVAKEIDKDGLHGLKNMPSLESPR